MIEPLDANARLEAAIGWSCTPPSSATIGWTAATPLKCVDATMICWTRSWPWPRRAERDDWSHSRPGRSTGSTPASQASSLRRDEARPRDRRRRLGARDRQGGADPRIFNLGGPFINHTQAYALGDFILTLTRTGRIAIGAADPVFRSFVHVSEMARVILDMAVDEAQPAELFDVGGPRSSNSAHSPGRSARPWGSPNRRSTVPNRATRPGDWYRRRRPTLSERPLPARRAAGRLVADRRRHGRLSGGDGGPGPARSGRSGPGSRRARRRRPGRHATRPWSGRRPVPGPDGAASLDRFWPGRNSGSAGPPRAARPGRSARPAGRSSPHVSAAIRATSPTGRAPSASGPKFQARSPPVGKAARARWIASQQPWSGSSTCCRPDGAGIAQDRRPRRARRPTGCPAAADRATSSPPPITLPARATPTAAPAARKYEA